MLRPYVATAVVVAVLALTPAAHARIPLELRFDGQAFDPKAPPDFSCFNDTRGRWTSCRVDKAGAPGAYVLERPEPGTYRMHVSIDENAANPRRYPGDYEAQLQFEVTATGPPRLIVDLPRLIHLTSPGDNGRSLEGMLSGGCATQPRFQTSRYAWDPQAKVDFAWEPIVAGAEYRYRLAVFPCRRSGAQREILEQTTGATAVTLSLPPSTEGEHYVFRVEAWKDGRLVGALSTHDSATHAWQYRFRVRDASLPRWLYVAGGAGLVLLALGARKALGGVDSRRRRSRMHLLARATGVALVLATVVFGAHH